MSPSDVRAFTAIKGIRDITSGIVPLVLYNTMGREALGWALLAASMTPVGDAMVVIARGGKTSVALGVHGLTAALLVGIGYVLTQVSRRSLDRRYTTDEAARLDDRAQEDMSASKPACGRGSERCGPASMQILRRARAIELLLMSPGEGRAGKEAFLERPDLHIVTPSLFPSEVC